MHQVKILHPHPAKMDLNKKSGPKPGSVQTMLFDA